MEKFIAALRQTIQDQNWHATLVVALTLPDICGRHAFPAITGGQERYTKWFDQYLSRNYVSRGGADGIQHIFLSGRDCYALRCSLLHEGTSAISHQRARVALNNFHFITPPKGGRIHLNQIDNKLQLQIDIFGEEVASACEKWWSSLSNSEQEGIDAQLLQIYTGNPFSP